MSEAIPNPQSSESGAALPSAGDARDPLPPPPPTSPRTPLPTPVLIAIIALLVALVGSFLPWARVLFFSVNGTDGDGIVTAIASGVALALLGAALRTGTRPLLLTSLASVSCAICTGTYVFDAARLTSWASPDEDSIIEISITPGFGLIVGAIGSAIAFSMLISLTVSAKRGRQVREHIPSLGARSVTILSVVSTVLVFLAFTHWWRATIALSVVGVVIWYFAKNSSVPSNIARLGVIGCFVATGGAVLEGFTVDSGQQTSRDCERIFESGADPTVVADTDTCRGPDGLTFVDLETKNCLDGRSLRMNQYGWGFAGEPWSSVTDAPAPYADCFGLADNRCALGFATGITTRSEWDSDPVTCLDPSGEAVNVYSFSWSCFDSNKRYVSNDYGWGYIDEPWRLGEPPGSC